MHLFTYNGRSSADYGLVLSGEDTWGRAVPDTERIPVPGRNGDILTFNDRYENVDISYRCGIKRDFPARFSEFMNFLLSAPGYHRLEDSYHPGHFRMAACLTHVQPEVGTLNRSGTFTVSFTCKPQMYLKAGENKTVFTSSGYLENPTLFSARPLLRIYGTGQVTVGSTVVKVNTNSGYTDVDCEIEDCFKETENRNKYVELATGEFPVLPPGRCGITLGSGISKVEVTPRWWQL